MEFFLTEFRAVLWSLCSPGGLSLLALAMATLWGGEEAGNGALAFVLIRGGSTAEGGAKGPGKAVVEWIKFKTRFFTRHLII